MLAEPLFAHPPERRGVLGMGERDSQHGENREAATRKPTINSMGSRVRPVFGSDFPFILMVCTATVCAVVDSRRRLTSQEVSCLVAPCSWWQPRMG